jgi:hypothetical protein
MVSPEYFDLCSSFCTKVIPTKVDPTLIQFLTEDMFGQYIKTVSLPTVNEGSKLMSSTLQPTKEELPVMY